MNQIAKKRLFLLRNALISMLLTLTFSCQEWGQWDDPSGNQKNEPAPDYTPVILAEYTFEDGLQGASFLYDNGTQPETVEDEIRGGNVVALNGAYLRFDNPLTESGTVNGASVTFWVKIAGTDTHGALFTFGDNDGNMLSFNGNSGFSFTNGNDYLKVNNPDKNLTAEFQPGEWHFVAVAFGLTDFAIYIDGEKKYSAADNFDIESSPDPFEYDTIVEFLLATPWFYLGYGAETDTKEAWYDDIKIYANTISSKEATREDAEITIPDPVYFNSFDESYMATIIGGGRFADSGETRFGTVFQNATGGMRQNYLLLPEDVLSHSTQTKALSVGVWVNASNAGGSSVYMWSPLFTAYASAPVNGENTWPMFVLQYRGITQVNCIGWCDFTDAQNVAGVNAVYHDSSDWLADGQWHYYTATFTSASAKVYFDGELKNEWKTDGISDGAVIDGLFSNGADLKYICLGGNQAWAWSDPDPGFMFDDIAIYNVELTPGIIAAIISEK